MANFTGTNNTFLTPDVIAREALMILENNVVAPQLMATSATADYAGARIGDTIRIRRPAFFGVNDYTSGAITIQDAVENSVNLVIEKQFDVSFEVSAKELALNVDDFNERLLMPAMSALAQKIDTYALSKILDLGGLAATTDYTAPNFLTEVAAVVEKMNIQNIPMTNRKMLVSPVMQTSLYGIPEFVRADIRGIGTSPVQEASLGRFMGLDTMMSQNMPVRSASSNAIGTALTTSGTDVSLLVNNASGYNEGDTSIAFDAGPAGTLTVKKYDTVSITYVDGVTRDHVVTADAAFASNAITLSISPGLYGVSGAAAVSGGVPVVVADNAVATLNGSNTSAGSPVTGYTVGAAFHPNAFQLVFVPQPNPMGPGTSAATVNYKGMSLRVLQSYDHQYKRDLISVDCLVGAAVVDGRLGVRIPSVNG